RPSDAGIQGRGMNTTRPANRRGAGASRMIGIRGLANAAGKVDTGGRGATSRVCDRYAVRSTVATAMTSTGCGGGTVGGGPPVSTITRDWMTFPGNARPVRAIYHTAARWAACPITTGWGRGKLIWPIMYVATAAEFLPANWYDPVPVNAGRNSAAVATY